MLTMAEAEIRKIIGDPREVNTSLTRFRNTARAFSSNHPRFIDEYPNKWLAVYDGAVVAFADTYDELLKKIDEEHLPRGQVMTRYIEENRRTLIL